MTRQRAKPVMHDGEQVKLAVIVNGRQWVIPLYVDNGKLLVFPDDEKMKARRRLRRKG